MPNCLLSHGAICFTPIDIFDGRLNENWHGRAGDALGSRFEHRSISTNITSLHRCHEALCNARFQAGLTKKQP